VMPRLVRDARTIAVTHRLVAIAVAVRRLVLRGLHVVALLAVVSRRRRSDRSGREDKGGKREMAGQVAHGVAGLQTGSHARGPGESQPWDIAGDPVADHGRQRWGRIPWT